MSLLRRPPTVLILLVLLAVLAACQGTPDPATPVPANVPPTATHVPPTATVPPPTATSIPPTATPSPSPTVTPVPPTPTPGPLPPMPILVYHHFGVPEAGEYDVPLDTFESHLRWLKERGYESVLPQQVVDAMAGKTTLPLHPVMITFDDNNAEQYADAAPLLEKYGYRGAFFVMTVTIGKRYYMSAEELRDLEARGHVVGGHTWDHRDMAILEPEELQKQLDDSERDLLEALGHKPLFVSYPYGGYTEAVVAELQRRGYHGAFRLDNVDDPQVDPPFMMHRALIPGVWTLDEFAARVREMEVPPTPVAP